MGNVLACFYISKDCSSINPIEETKILDNEYKEDYRATFGIDIRKEISIRYPEISSLLKSYGASFSKSDLNGIIDFYGFLGTDLVLFQCETSSGYTIFTQKEFLDLITKKVPFDFWRNDNPEAYNKEYDISSSKYTGKVFLKRIMPLALVDGTTREKDYVYLVWKKRNGEYLYLSYTDFMTLSVPNRDKLLNYCRISPVDFPDPSYRQIEGIEI